MKRFTDAERRAHNTEQKRRWRAQRRAAQQPQPKGRQRRIWQQHKPRCPVCGCEISATIDCRCP